MNLLWTPPQNPQGPPSTHRPPAWGPCVHPEASISPSLPCSFLTEVTSVPNSFSAQGGPLLANRPPPRGLGVNSPTCVHGPPTGMGRRVPSWREGQSPRLLGVVSDPLPPGAWAQRGGQPLTLFLPAVLFLSTFQQNLPLSWEEMPLFKSENLTKPNQTKKVFMSHSAYLSPRIKIQVLG